MKLKILLFFLAAFPAVVRAQTAPRLFIKPAPVFDRICEQLTGYKVDPAVQLELFHKAGGFQSLWDKDAAVLIAASEVAAGRKYARIEYSVALTACRWVPMGDPAFIVSARPYLGAKAEPMLEFVAMTHHELLHPLVDNIETEAFANASPMILKYQAEPINVLVHLHLMAIQKASYQALGREDLLKLSDRLYLEVIGGEYKRAWEIVAQEGTRPFLNELQEYNAKKD